MSQCRARGPRLAWRQCWLLWRWLALCGLAWCGCAPAWAHKPSDSYLVLTAQAGGRVDVDWHIALRDLDSELVLDANEDGRLTWGEVRRRWADIGRLARPALRLRHDGRDCALQPGSQRPPALIEHTDGQYAVLGWTQQCPLAAGQAWSAIEVGYGLFSLSDPTHRGIVRLRVQDAPTGATREAGSVVLGGDRASYRLGWGEPPAPGQASASGAAPWRLVLRYVRDGVAHIGTGLDHILFLVSLLLVAVWRRNAPADTAPGRVGHWSPRASWRAALLEVLRLVTAFTLAHSLTLGLAAFGVFAPPSRWVESLIALSVLVAALDNLWPLLRAPRWLVVFGFGLVHGFGFAGAMQDLGLSRQDLAWPLLGFNLGVELGQLVVVAAVLPPAFALRGTRFYRQGVVPPASAGIAVLAALWFYQRAADVALAWWPGWLPG